MNIAWWIKTLADGEPPTFLRCHVRMRVADDRPSGVDGIDALLDTATSLPDGSRRERIEATMGDAVIPFLLGASSLAELSDYYRAGHFRFALVYGVARPLLADDSAS